MAKNNNQCVPKTIIELLLLLLVTYCNRIATYLSNLWAFAKKSRTNVTTTAERNWIYVWKRNIGGQNATSLRSGQVQMCFWLCLIKIKTAKNETHRILLLLCNFVSFLWKRIPFLLSTPFKNWFVVVYLCYFRQFGLK